LEVHDSAEFRTPDNIFIKEMNLKTAGMVVRQHSHKYGHTTLLASGSVRAWRDGESLGDFVAPTQIYIPAHTKHAFVSLEPNTLAYCIHRLEDGEASVEIHEAHTQSDVEKLFAAA
jgi:quercetin dioxygenase-like cupin family protein